MKAQNATDTSFFKLSSVIQDLFKSAVVKRWNVSH